MENSNKTIKLYDEDSYITEFSATVKSVTPHKDGFLILLDQTAFFPTAGGQTCDTGFVDGQEVLEVTISDDEVFHLVKNPLEIGKIVECKINWAERFRKMQHHSAEHILSGIAFSEFGAENVGFHLSDSEVTMDYNREFSKDEVIRLECLANEAVQKNLKITTTYPDENTLKNIAYRSKLELIDNVRIVTIDGVDVCACCAPHVKNTGEIGLIKIVDFTRHRGGMRLKMICGMDALSDFQKKKDSAEKISGLLSAKQEEITLAVEKLLLENGELKQQINALKKAIMTKTAENIAKTDGNFTLFLDDCDRTSMRYLAGIAKSKVSGVLAVLSPNEKGGFNYILSSERVKLLEVSQKINNELSGHGGGREDIEGTFSASREKIEKYFKTESF